MIAPDRAGRPGADAPAIEPLSQEELDACPFCAGREDRTPPETLRLGDPWRVRVVPNLYPAFERHEVVVHSPRHARSLDELDDDEIAVVAEAWQRRARDEPAAYLYAFVNEGRLAGASLAHSHSQLVWLPGPPPAVRAESGPLPLEENVVLERGGVVLTCPPAGRSPYDLLVAPAEPEGGAFESPRLAAALWLVAEGLRRVRRGVGPCPANVWLHDGPRWHLEVLPRLTTYAGLELGAGIWVSTLAPEVAASQLRG